MFKALKKTNFTQGILDAINFSIIFLVVYLLLVPLYPLLADKLPVLNRSNQEIASAKNIRNTLPANPDKPKANKLLANADKSAAKTAKPAATAVNMPSVAAKPASAIAAKTISNRLVIKKIGVDAPIIVTDSEKLGLSKGVWRYPTSKDPNNNGNFIISGHRYKYLPPHSVTFYSLDKMQPGDEIDVTWNNTDYVYKVKEVKVVQPNDASVIQQTDDSIITLITCTPLFTTQKRLIVIGEMVK